MLKLFLSLKVVDLRSLSLNALDEWGLKFLMAN